MRSFGARAAGEMLFWDGGRAVAGISLLWRSEATPLCVERAFAVRDYVDFSLLGMVEGLDAALDSRSAALDLLSAREREVARLLCRGFSSARIATELHIGLATVKTHLLHIYTKTGVSNRASLVALLMRGH